LAWESSGPDIGNGDGRSAWDFFNVLVLRNVRPVLCEDRPAERIDVALVRNLETCSFEPKVEPSNPREQRRESKFQPRLALAVSERGGSAFRSFLSRACSSLVSHAHMTIRFQPRCRNSRPRLLSRSTFRSILTFQ
jgi:hypothetical protein